MALWSSSRPGIKVRVLPKLPATLTATGGLSVEKENGIWTFSPDWASLIEGVSISDPDAFEIWLHNTTSDAYSRMSVSNFLATVAQSGAGLTFPITIRTDTNADADPGAGKLTFDNADQTAATTLYIDLTDINGLDITAVLDAFDDSSSPLKGYLSLTKIGDATKRLIYSVTAVTTATGYRKITVANVAASGGASTFAADDPVLAQFLSNGDASGGTVALSDLNIAGGTALTSPAVDDTTAISDTSASGASKQITLANLFKVITALTAETSPATDDELALYDTSAGTADKITLANLLKVINALTADTTPDQAADYVTTYDDSASAAKKVLLQKIGIGKHTVGAAAGTLYPASTNGCAALAQAETSTNKINYKYLAFDPTSIEYAWFWIPTPKSYNASTVTFRAVWTHPSTATNFSVVWQFEVLSLSNDDAIDTAVGTAVTVTDTGGTTQDFYTADASAAVTPSNTAAKQDWLAIRVSRKASDVSDTMAVDAHLIGVECYYSTDVNTDD